MNPKVDFYFSKSQKWHNEVSMLRAIILEMGLHEELKWGCPCYVSQKANIVLIHEFKDYCALLFFKGALLMDSENRLIQQTENVQAARQLRFRNLSEILSIRNTIISYIYEAIEVEKAGLKVSLKKTEAYKIPEEFQNKLDENPLLKSAFERLTPGRQRAYLLYFSSAKQSKTRESRIDNHISKIIEGKGLDD